MKKKHGFILIIVILLVSSIWVTFLKYNLKTNDTIAVNNNISQIDIPSVYQLKDISVDKGKLVGKIFNDDDYRRDLTLSVKLLLNNKEVYTDKFIVKNVDVGGTKAFDFNIKNVKYDDYKVEVVGTKYVTN